MGGVSSQRGGRPGIRSSIDDSSYCPSSPSSTALFASVGHSGFSLLERCVDHNALDCLPWLLKLKGVRATLEEPWSV